MTRRWIGRRVLRRPSTIARIASSATSVIVADLVRRPAEVLERERPQGDLVDADLGAPVDQLEGLLGPGPVPGTGIGEALGRGPAPVAVHDHGDVVGPGRRQDPRPEALEIEGVDRCQGQVAHPPIGRPEAFPERPRPAGWCGDRRISRQFRPE